MLKMLSSRTWFPFLHVKWLSITGCTRQGAGNLSACYHDTIEMSSSFCDDDTTVQFHAFATVSFAVECTLFPLHRLIIAKTSYIHIFGISFGFLLS